MKRQEFTAFLDELFREVKANDYSNNGLQAEGRDEVRKVGFAVDACVQTFEMALQAGCDFLFCHHGISWGGGIQRFTGYQAARLRTLLANGLSLYAMHLPLDAHPAVGNNAQLAELVGIPVEHRRAFGFYQGQSIGFGGELATPVSCDDLAAKLDAALGGTSRVFCFREDRMLRSIGIVSGGGAFAIDEGAAAGYDALLTGEVSHQHYHYIREQGFCVIASGHYATETTGPRAVQRAVQARFPELECIFLDAPTAL